MPVLNILVCNDQRNRDFNSMLLAAKKRGRKEDETLYSEICEEINLDGPLCRNLRAKGHKVTLFDGREAGDHITTIHSSRQLANRIADLIIANDANAMILDLNFFGNFQAGVEIMKFLIQDQSIPSDMKPRLIIYSNFLNQPEFNYTEVLTTECGIPRENLLTRTMVDIYAVARRVESWK